MQTDSEKRPIPAWIKAVLFIITAVFLVIQAWTLLGPDGIMAHYSFMEGFTEFGAMMTADPLLSAGLYDLVFLQIAFVFILLNGIPRGPAFPYIFIVFVLAMIVYPAVAGLAFLILYWRRLGQFRP